ncbi:MAG TPA: hypothetical protein VF695_12510 [Sphingomonas sp.]|jgi:hypothetical protein
MGLRSFFADLFSRLTPSSGPEVNPATGLPMLDGGVDVQGSPYGTDAHRHDDPSGAGTGAGAGTLNHDHPGSPTSNDWSSSSWSGVSTSWPDHSSSSSSFGGGYDPLRGW